MSFQCCCCGCFLSFGTSFLLGSFLKTLILSSFRNEFSFYLMFILIADPISMFTRSFGRFSLHLQNTQKKKNRKGNDQNSIFFDTFYVSMYSVYTHNSNALKYVTTTSHISIQHIINSEHFHNINDQKIHNVYKRRVCVSLTIVFAANHSFSNFRFLIIPFLSSILLLLMLYRRRCCCSFWLHSPVLN